MSAVRPRGPWFHRFLIWFFAIVLVFLNYWTLSFLIDDIGGWMPPDMQAIHLAHLPADAVRQSAELTAKAETLNGRAQRLREQQRLLREGTDNYQRTMQQMAELERLRLQKGEQATQEQQEAVAQAERQFLKNQHEFQKKTEEVTQLAEEEDQVRQQLVPVQKRIEDARQAALAAYQIEYEHWQWRVAVVKIGLLLPLIVLAAALFRSYRSSLYAPLVYAFGIAVGAKTMIVVHTYFPSAYFKYVLIGSSLIFVTWLLVKLVRMVARPNVNWLLKQYREAYEAFLCPVCEYPIRRGPLKYLAWTKSTIKRLPLANLGNGHEPEVPYTCPMCATRLYEECGHCHAVRPALLPACSSCGEVKPIEVAN